MNRVRPLFLLPLFILVGCRTNGNGVDSPPDSPQVNIVAILPLTGPAASLGEQVRAGLEVASDSLPNVTISFEDSQSQPAQAVTVANRVLARAGDGRFGFVTALSSVSRAVAPIATGANRPIAMTLVATPGLASEYENAAQFFWTTDEFIPPLAHIIAERHDRVAVLTLSDEYGQANLQSIREVIPGSEIIFHEEWPLAPADMAALAGRVMQSNPDAVLVTGYGGNYISLLQQLSPRLRDDQTLYTGIDLSDPGTRSAVGTAAEGIIFPALQPDIGVEGNVRLRSFQQRAEARLGRPVYYAGALYAHDALIRLNAALTGNGSLSEPVTGELIPTLAQKGLVIARIENGSPVAYQSTAEPVAAGEE